MVTERKVFEDGSPNFDFLFKNNLNSDSLPHNWFEAFLPPRITGQWTNFTNMKALLDNAGNEGEIYPDFTPFLPAELRQYIALYMIHGLNPSPSLEKSFSLKSRIVLAGMTSLKEILALVHNVD